MSGSNFSPPRYSYGGGQGRYLICKVVNRKDDPEQSGRLQVRVLGYQDDTGMIPDQDLPWARPLHGVNNPMDGGVGGPVTGATENTYMIGFFSDGQQQIMLTHTIGKAGKDNNGQLDQSGRNSDTNPHSRDKDHQGGDFRYNSNSQNFEQKSITDYAKDESPNPYGRTVSKDGDETNSWSLGQYQFQ
jgi:hypothetical protein